MTRHTSQSLRIALLAGGESDERAISLKSGAAVHRALACHGHAVVLLDPQIVDLESADWSQFDVAFLALHGAYGEDGQVQSLLDKLGVPYTGSDAQASRLAFCKSSAKERFMERGVPTPPFMLVHCADERTQTLWMASQVGLPCVVKPDTQGSSLGISIVREGSEIDPALEQCFRYDAFGIAEQYIEGDEWTVALLDDQPFAPIRIVTSRPFFDYAAKYLDEDTGYYFDASPDLALRLQDIAVAACRALGTRGMTRVDLRVDRQGQPWVLEVNTIPGMTDHSLVPKAAAHAGLDFADLCERTVHDCLAGRPRRPYHLHNAFARRA